jgi:beta-aspartyl-peptidase (threonine type)
VVTLVVVHGGVADVAREQTLALGHAIPRALEAAHALDAVEAAVRALEDDPALNAGFGAVLTRTGTLELDAGIADGASGGWGGVANVTVRHPITLARRVLERTPHVLVAGRGAHELAEDMEMLEDTTESQRRRWLRAREHGSLGPESYAAMGHVDTVGAVALDTDGGLAAGSSTGGVFGKMPGRIGDAPVFGAGIYASRAAAAVGTGVGERFLESLACLEVGRLVEAGEDPQHACERVIDELGTRSDAAAGLLAVDAHGRVGAAYRGGSWAVEGPAGPVEATPRP